LRKDDGKKANRSDLRECAPTPSQNLVAKPLPLSEKRNKCSVSGTIFPGARHVKIYLPGTV
jgi:hypothetical protein